MPGWDSAKASAGPPERENLTNTLDFPVARKLAVVPHHLTVIIPVLFPTDFDLVRLPFGDIRTHSSSRSKVLLLLLSVFSSCANRFVFCSNHDE